MWFQKETNASCTSYVTEEEGACLDCEQVASEAEPAPAARAEDRADCSCRRLDPKLCSTCVDNTSGEICKKCDTAKTLASDNSKTKCKLEQLRLVMQQKKQRREARKLKTLPYTNSPSKALVAPEQAPVLQEEIETVA